MIADLTGKYLGNYQIITEIGSGGMGTVYRAFDPRLQREVAIKVLRPELTSDPEVLQRFQVEAVTAANLQHPNIVVVHDVGAADGYQYLVMELLRGHTLTDEIRACGHFPLSRATHVLAQLASALDHAHAHNLVHRDVKSGNVIIRPDDHVTLMDFGLVKTLGRQGVAITQTGLALGTLNYMAPEQIAGAQVDRHADIYALGVLGFEMLTGALPFQGPSPRQVIVDIMHRPPPSLSQSNPALAPQVDAVLQRALAKEPRQRFSTASEMVHALVRLPAPAGLQLVGGAGGAVSLRQAGTSIGRGSDNDVVLADHDISRYHARIYCEASSWFVTDMGSTNGTFVNGMRLAPHMAHPLAANDGLRLGFTTVFQVLGADAAAEPDTHTTSLH